MAGLIDFLQSPGAMQMAASLLESGGPNPQPVGTGQAIGRSLLAYQQGQDLGMQRKYREAQMAQILADQQREKEAEAAWQNVGNANPADFGINAPENMPWADATKIPEFRAQIARGMFPGEGDSPKSVQEWKFYNSLPQEQKQQYLVMKRAEQWKDLGNQVVMPTPGMPGQISAILPKGISPDAQPWLKAAQEEAKQGVELTYAGPIAAGRAAGGATGKSVGEAEASLSDMESTMPRLNNVVSELSDLGKKATYTKIGQGADIAKRELGVDVGEGAIARKQYISKVDNEILPLLRQTFGAQFTEREGQSLKATLGDPNASPEEKDAVLSSFIETKKGQIESLRRRTKKSPAGGPAQPGAGPQGKVRRYNPATGRIE
jgi:hypothetical protein